MQIIIFSIIQGISEFLPISSSCNLMAAANWLQLGDMSLSLKIALHVGSLITLLIYFHRQLWSIVQALFNRGKKLRDTFFWPMTLGTLPVVFAGSVAHNFISEFDSPAFAGINLIIFGIALWWCDKTGPKWKQSNKILLYIRDLLIGIFQSLAIIPGVSRLGICLIGCRIVGMKRPEAIQTSLILAIPSIAGSLVLEILHLPITTIFNKTATIGMLCTAAIGMLAIHPCVKFMTRYGFFAIMIYRIALGLLLIFV